MQDIEADIGLNIARALLDPLQIKYPITHADLWSFAAACVVSNSGGPEITWFPGRNDAYDATHRPYPDGVLPSPLSAPNDLRGIFYRMGFQDQDIVALSGAHNFGKLIL
jgi:cytochrome c peroxidase